MGEMRNAYNFFFLKSLEGRNLLEGIGVDGRVILKLVLKKLGGRVWTGFIWLRLGTSGGIL
jgi:hypothetical protein